MRGTLLLIAASIIALSACSRKADAPAADAGAAAVDHAAIAAAAVADPRRSEADRAEDARRKPAAALEFFRVGPGMAIFEIEAGAGWYTELLGLAAGPEGSVVMQNPDSFLAFVGEQVEARLAGGRLGSVRQSLSAFDSLDAADASIDLVTWVQGPHELYFMPGDGARFGDPARAYTEIFRILKPGGVFAAIDHSAAAGAPEASGNALHRIDRAIVIRMAESAGFRLEAESAFLANPDDPLNVTVFDPAIRGNIDQFALRFRKPR